MQHHRALSTLLLFATAWGLCLATPAGGALAAGSGLKAEVAAERLAGLLDKESAAKSDEEVAAATNARADDESFLRRLSLDLVGEPPTPEEITAFALDPATDKRARVIDRLLADERFGINWGRYWRDVIMYRRSDERALIASRSVVDYLAARFNENTPWDEIARSFVTASGNLAEDGRTALLVSQWGQVPETAAEVSRVLMGVQIQCAQCHDHPIDRWRREQFHELAAFFPRIAVRRIRDPNEPKKRRGFELVSNNRGRKKKKKPSGAADKGREHYMPDLDDPTAKGALMQPVFFVTGQKLETGLPDRRRREALADWITSEENPWFARAFVNRIWAEMIGKGFYEPIDDLGPDRDCSSPKAMNFLSKQFVAGGHDVKWLFKTIAFSDAYQRESAAQHTSEDATLAADCPQRLRGDQLFSALAGTLGFDEQAADSKQPPRRGPPRTPRAQFNRLFGYDPSTPRDEISGSIPQALALMNAKVINGAIRADGANSALGRLLAQTDDDEEIVVELYLRTLARQPKEPEIETCHKYIAEVGDRTEALEDILWALINSTEFLYRE